jgi:signal transduction histidine kinase
MQSAAMRKWAHDIRNTLGTVALYADALRRPADPQVASLIAGIHALLGTASAMCDAAAEAEPQGAARRSAFDLVLLLQEVRDLVAPTLPASCDIEVVAASHLSVRADARDVFRILFNLVHNAATIARRGALRRIRIAAECTEVTAILSVADDGPGLPKSVRSRLFRGGRSTTGGSGYGLAIARELAERNGGMLDLAEAFAGTTFVIELPRAAAPASASPRCVSNPSMSALTLDAMEQSARARQGRIRHGVHPQ